MTLENVAFTIPTTCRGRDWKTIEESYLYSILLKSLSNSCPDNDITLYIGYDVGDKIFDDTENQFKINCKYHMFKFKWFSFTPDPGNVVKIWNNLARYAFQDGFDYVKIIGDDIRFPNDKYWLSSFIKQLKKNNNIGWSAGYSNNDLIATQFLIHRVHWDIYHHVFPEQLTNYYCDDYLNNLYPDKYKNWNRSFPLLNCGGEPRYIPNDDLELMKRLVRRHRPALMCYLSKLH